MLMVVNVLLPYTGLAAVGGAVMVEETMETGDGEDPASSPPVPVPVPVLPVPVLPVPVLPVSDPVPVLKPGPVLPFPVGLTSDWIVIRGV